MTNIKKSIFLKSIFSVFICFFVLYFFSINAKAIGNYGVNLDSSAYNNKFSWGQCTWYCYGRAKEKLGIDLPWTGNACSWGSPNYGYTVDTTPSANSILVNDWNDGVGHVMFVEKMEGNIIYTTESNVNDLAYHEATIDTSTWRITRDTGSSYIISGSIKFIHLKSNNPTGSEMTSGYSRVLPDGDYVIASAGSTDKSKFYYLDIQGTYVTEKTNVAICETNDPIEIGEYEIWTIKYEDGFYTIKQKGSDMTLDVAGASIESNANVQAYPYNGGSNQKWAISLNSRKDGYRIQAKVSGFSLDVAGGNVVKGSNVQVFTNHDLSNQSWFFVPYKPKQPLANGKYVFISSLDSNFAMGIDKSNTSQNLINVQLSNSVKDTYNVFEITKLENGYYKIVNSATGKALELTNGGSTIGDNINVLTPNGSIPQQWQIKANGDGYTLTQRCSGWTLSVANGKAVTGSNINQQKYTGGKEQTWNIVTVESLQKAKYKVAHYQENLDGSYKRVTVETLTGTPGKKVSPAVKSYSGFTSPSKKSATIKSDGSTVIKYYYTRNTYKLTWDLGGGKASGSYTKGSVEYGAKITAPTTVKKSGYVFKGWSVSVPKTMPAKNLTIKAKWEASNQKEVQAFVTRFYKVFLNRKPEKEGLDYWTENLISKKMTGADVARGFVMSKEMSNRNLSNEEFVTLMYKGFFDRVPDASGYSYWVGKLNSGYSKEMVVAGFVNSQEFKNLCKKYKINPGSL